MIIPYLIAQLIGKTDAGNRVYPVIIPQDESFPAIRLTHVSLTGDDSKAIRSCLDTSTVQISVFAHSYRSAREIAGKVRELLDRTTYRVTTPEGIISDTTVDAIRDGNYEQDKRLFHCIVQLTATSQNIP